MPSFRNSRGHPNKKCVVEILLAISLWGAIGACSIKGTRNGTISGSELLGRYNPQSVLSSPKTPACWASEAGEIRSGGVASGQEATAQWDFLKPVIEAKIKEQIVERTDGVLNPFPGQTTSLPNCSNESGARIKIYLGDFSSEKTRVKAQNNEQTQAGVAGIYYQSCERIERLSASSKTGQLVVAGDTLNIRPILASFGMQRSCIVLFAGFINHLVGKNVETLKAYTVGTALHELLHAYGIDEEHLHSENMEKIVAGRQDASTCDPFKRFGVKRELATGSGKDFGHYDPESIMNYCFSNDSKLEKVVLSEGDVKLLKFLYPSSGAAGAASPLPPAHDENQAIASPIAETTPLPTKPEQSPNPNTQNKDTTLPGTQEAFGQLNCKNKRAASFSAFWETYYEFTGSLTQGYTVRVTARKVGATAQAPSSWGEHPVHAGSAFDVRNYKFVTYIQGNSRFLVHKPNLARPSEFVTAELQCDI